MQHWIGAAALAGCLSIGAFGAGKGPEIAIVDDKVSVTAEAVPIGRLLRLFDQATGMQSKVPPDLANRNVTVRFTGLSVDDAVKKIFEGQPFDYVVLGGQGIVVTAMSQPLSGATEAAPPVYTPPQAIEQPFVQDFQPMPPQPIAPGVPGAGLGPQQQPAVIQTPFGPIPNPRANQPVPANGNMAPGIPGQPGMLGAPSFGVPAQQPGVQNPAGTNDLFGNTPIFQNPGAPASNPQQQRRP